MYNRYMQSDRGSYIPIPEEPQHPSEHAFEADHIPSSELSGSEKKPGHSLEGLKSLWNTLIDRFHIDAGDLLLLAMLYFLYREDADEELLIALGLLLLL